jgi:excisionase family DNA binding protein
VTQLLTVEDVADALKASETTAKRLISSGKLPSVHIGRSVRVRPSDLQKFIEALPANGSEKEVA